MAATEHGADGEHRPDMALPRCLLEQGQSPRMILCPAAAGQHHVCQHDLSFDHTDFGRLGDPDAAFPRVGFDAPALDQHAPVPVLCVDHAVRCPPEPFGCLAVVALDAEAFGQTNTEIECRDQVARGSCLLEPFACADLVLFVAVAAQQQVSEIDMGTGVAALCGNAEQFGGFVLVAWDSGAGKIEHAQRTRAAAVIGVGGAPEPRGRLGVIRWQVTTLGIDIADQRGRLRIASQGGAAQPRLAFHRIGCGAVAGHQGEAPARLGSAVAFLGRQLVTDRGGDAILWNVHAALLDHAVEIERGRQPLLRGLTEMREQLRLGFGGGGVACQDERIAELALRATSGGGFLVPTVALGEVAKAFGAGGQDEAENRLALG
jgi:hypothetical protein